MRSTGRPYEKKVLFVYLFFLYFHTLEFQCLVRFFMVAFVLIGKDKCFINTFLLAADFNHLINTVYLSVYLSRLYK